jgi:hypothetical protein
MNCLSLFFGLSIGNNREAIFPFGLIQVGIGTSIVGRKQETVSSLIVPTREREKETF